MAIKKIVDSTQLDANLASVADAIRAKSGGSSQLTFPAGFVSAVEAIPTGGGAQLYKINGAEHDFQSLTIDGTTFAEDYTNVVMGYAPEGATVSAQMKIKFLLTGVTNDATGVAIPTTTQTVYGKTIHTFTMPASSVTVTTFYDD